jgi:hypothetical protein
MSDIPTVGYVYIINNPSFRENLRKIGMTTEVPDRMSSLFTTGVPEPFTIEYLLKFYNNEHRTVETCIHRIFGPQRNNSRREFFNITLDQAAAIVELLTIVGVELVDPSEYNQQRTTSRITNHSRSNISQENKEWFMQLLETLIDTDDRERVQNMSQGQQKGYLRNNSLNGIIVGLGENLDGFKRAVDELDNTTVTDYCNSLLQGVANSYSRAFIRLIKYHYQ